MNDFSLPEAAAVIATAEMWKPKTNGSGADASDADGSKVILVRGSDLAPRKISWCWHGWLARGKMHVIAGPSGSGKTTIALRFIATVTRGGRWPDGTCHPGGGNAIIWSGEDDL